MDASTLTIDLALMEPVPRPCIAQNTMAVNVSASGHIALNQRLYDAVVREVPSLELDFRIDPDRTVLLLRPSDTPNYKFPKGGRIKDQAFSRSLVQAGVALPARYEVAWNPSVGGWVGTLTQTVQTSEKKALAESLKPAKKRKGAVSHERK